MAAGRLEAVADVTGRWWVGGVLLMWLVVHLADGRQGGRGGHWRRAVGHLRWVVDHLRQAAVVEVVCGRWFI